MNTGTGRDLAFGLDFFYPQLLLLSLILQGPIACELAQAFVIFGSDVTVLYRGKQPLRNEDPDAAEILLTQLRKDGVKFITGANIEKLTSGGNTSEGGGSTGPEAITVQYKCDDGEHTLACDTLLIATGRAANVKGQGLDVRNCACILCGCRSVCTPVLLSPSLSSGHKTAF